MCSLIEQPGCAVLANLIFCMHAVKIMRCVWSNEPPAQAFITVLREVFDQPEAAIVEFFSPASGRMESNTIYLGSKPLG